jgi:DNA polymerase-3 subunit gamma/tau
MYAGRDLYQFEKDFLEYLRKILLVKVGASSDFGFTQEIQDKFKAQAEALSLPRITKIIQIFQKAESEIKWATIQSLPLELAAVEATFKSENTVIPTDLASVKQSGSGGIPLVSDSSTRPGFSETTETGLPRNDNNTLNIILGAWPQILDKLKDYNHSLISSLKLAVPTAVEGNNLILLFTYKFHKDAIEARKNRIVVDQVIEDVSGLKLIVKPMMQKEYSGEALPLISEPQEAKADELVGSALKIMGGQVE